jgi:hypothetical protein
MKFLTLVLIASVLLVGKTLHDLHVVKTTGQITEAVKVLTKAR